MWLYLNKAISCGFWWLTGLKLLQKFSFMRLTSFTIQTTEVAVFVLICRAVGLPPCSAVSHFKTSLWVCCGGFEENDQDRHKNLWIWMWGLKKKKTNKWKSEWWINRFFLKRVPKQAGGVMFGYIKVPKLVMIRQEWETGIKHGDLWAKTCFVIVMKLP